MQLHLGLLPLHEVEIWDNSRYLRLTELLAHVTSKTPISPSYAAWLIVETTWPHQYKNVPAHNRNLQKLQHSNRNLEQNKYYSSKSLSLQGKIK